MREQPPLDKLRALPRLSMLSNVQLGFLTGLSKPSQKAISPSANLFIINAGKTGGTCGQR